MNVSLMGFFYILKTLKNKHILLLILYTIQCNSLLLKSKIYFLLNLCDIKVKIRGNTNKRMDCVFCPKEIYSIDGTQMTRNDYHIMLPDDLNNFILKYDEPLDGMQLFESPDLLEVEFSGCQMDEYMSSIFFNCVSLASIIFTSIDVSNVYYIYNAFKDCKSLKSIDLSNLDLSYVGQFQHMFDGCENLEYINFINYKESQIMDNNMEYSLTIDDNVPSNLVICINQADAPILYESLQNRGCTVIYCGDDWKEKQKKIIEELNRFIDNCANINAYPYEYNSKCYQQCPQGTKPNDLSICEIIEDSLESSEMTKNNNNILSESSGIIETEKLKQIKTECYETTKNNVNISSNNIETDRNNGINIEYPISEIINFKEINNTFESFINYIKEGNFKKFILEKNETEIIKNTSNEIYQITTLSSQLIDKNNITTIHLEICEKELKKANNLEIDEELIIIKISHFIPGFKIQIIEYEVYSMDGIKLNLDSCSNSIITNDIPVEINEKDLDMYNPNSDFYNDICFQYTSDEGTDMTNYDRKNLFNEKNMSLCENNCEFREYNKEKKRAICDCKIKNIFNNFDKIDKKQLLKQFINYKKIFNIEVMKCFRLLFINKGFISNIGSLITLIIIFICIVLSIIFCIKEYNSFFAIINKTININSKVINIKNNSQNKKSKKTKNKKKSLFPPKKRKINPKLKKSLKSPEVKSSAIENDEKKDSKTKINPKNKEKNINRNDYELNSLNYDNAIKYDERTFCQYYLSLIRLKQPLIFTFYTKSDYNSRIIKICSFFTSFIINYFIKALFFNDSVMHVIYVNKGVYDIIYQIPQILYSTIISIFIGFLLSILSKTQANVIEIKNLKKEKDGYKKRYNELLKIIRIKFIFFYIINFLLLFVFWYYLACFCSVYKNTQIYLIKDVFISFGLTLIYPFIINIFPSIIRMLALNSKKDKRKCLYSFSKILQII